MGVYFRDWQSGTRGRAYSKAWIFWFPSHFLSFPAVTVDWPMRMPGPVWRRICGAGGWVGGGWPWGSYWTWDALGPQWRFGFGLGLTVIMVEGCYLVWEGASVSSFCGGWPFDSALVRGGGERRACPWGMAYAPNLPPAGGRDCAGVGSGGLAQGARDGLPGGPHPNLPPAGGRDFWFTSQ